MPCVLLSAVFCIYYIVRGVLQENRQELLLFVLSILVLMVRSVVNFSVLGSKGKEELLVGLPLLVEPEMTPQKDVLER